MENTASGNPTDNPTEEPTTDSNVYFQMRCPFKFRDVIKCSFVVDFYIIIAANIQKDLSFYLQQIRCTSQLY